MPFVKIHGAQLSRLIGRMQIVRDRVPATAAQLPMLDSWPRRYHLAWGNGGSVNLVG